MAIEGVFAVMPLLILILLGYSCATRPWFGKEGMHFLSKFTIGIAIPLYMFSNVTKMYGSPRELLHLLNNVHYPAIIVVVNLILAALATKLLDIHAPRRGVFINAVSLSNTIVMGMPVVVSLFGESVLPTTMIFYASNTIMYWTIGVWILRRETSDRDPKGVLGTVKEVFSTRPLLGFLIGMAWVALGIPVPVFLSRTLTLIGNSVTPLAMMFIGCVIRFADFSNIRKFRELWLLLGYRYLMVPLFAAGMISLMPIPSLMKQIFFILTNMPAMAQLPIMAREVGSDYELASLATAVTTAVSMAAVPLYIFLMEYSGIFAG